MEGSIIYAIFGLLFVLGYVYIAVEHKTHINKSGIALVLGSALWFIIAIMSHDKAEISHALAENGGEIFSIVVFLLSAMTIVEILVHFQLFDWIREKIVQKKI